MVRITLAILAFLQLTLVVALSSQPLAQEWTVRKIRGTLRVVDLHAVGHDMKMNYAEPLVTLDKDNNWEPCLARDWRWIDDRTMEFRLREAVRFHNGEKFNAEAVKVNWEYYRKMGNPTWFRFIAVPAETIFEIIDEYTVRFTFPEPEGLALVKLHYFLQFAPEFFINHKFEEPFYGHLLEPGPWGTGPFKLVQGGANPARPSERVVLEANEDYWDSRYPKVERVIFENTLMGDRKEAMRLCREEEGEVDIVNRIRPLDTLKVATSPFAKVVKSKDLYVLNGVFNERKRDSKWRDIRLRKAINYAINRKELWKYAAKGNAYNLEGYPVPLGAYGLNLNLTPWTYDTTKARSLLAEAGYPEGFEVKIITHEALQVEVQIIKRMLERIGLKVSFDVLTWPEFIRKTHIPILDKPPEEQDWDINFNQSWDWSGHVASCFLVWTTEQGDWRWNEYDPAYEEMWKDMAKTVDPEVQEEKIRQMIKYFHDIAFYAIVYSPLSLYAVNKEVNFVPHMCAFRLKDTSVTDNHWSVREEKEVDPGAE